MQTTEVRQLSKSVHIRGKFRETGLWEAPRVGFDKRPPTWGSKGYNGVGRPRTGINLAPGPVSDAGSLSIGSISLPSRSLRCWCCYHEDDIRLVLGLAHIQFRQ